jgi:3-phenylpropionate/trans-cinnamate dioxygenase ferredoxin reductase subunit
MRDRGSEREIIMFSDEDRPPYERPPLSKDCLKSGTPSNSLLRDRDEIDLRLNSRVSRVFADDVSVELESGERFQGEDIVLCVGGQARMLPGAPTNKQGLYTLRTWNDAAAIHKALQLAEKVVLVGGGVIGLEVAAVAALVGKDVTVLEQDPSPAGRFAGPLAAAIQTWHAAKGIAFRTGVGVEEVIAERHVKGVRLTSGETIDADLVVVGIGLELEGLDGVSMEPRSGIVIDESGRTGIPHVYAAGDLATQHNPYFGRSLRLETIHNAESQADQVAATLLGEGLAKATPPYGWSDQGDLNLQSLGVCGSDDVVFRGHRDAGSFSAFYFDGPRVVGCFSFNAGRDISAARRMIGQAIEIDREALADTDTSLRDVLKGAVRA